jgi:hypothetical protein
VSGLKLSVVEELMAVTITHDPAARRRSYELLAEAFGLEGRKVVGDAAGFRAG